MKNHVDISYQNLRDIFAAGIVNPIKVCTKVNKSYTLTKSMLVDTLGKLYNTSNGVVQEEA